MKKLALAIIVLFTSAATVHATQAEAKITAESSWEEIFNAGLLAKFPKEQFFNTFVSVYSTCTTGETLMAEVRRCTEWATTGNRSECVRKETVLASKPMIEEVTYCKRSYGGQARKCAEWGTTTREIATSYMIPVYRQNGVAKQFMFKKAFDIPACGE